jgi:ubiquinone/menaquinone biosynthesis C-methylase UbiE
MNEEFYVGADVDEGSLKECPEPNKILTNASSLPFREGSFDLISSNMVFEHLADPLAVLREAHRVLSDGGNLIIHTPSSSHFILIIGRILSSFLPANIYRKLVSSYEGRKEADIFPTYYRANSEKLVADLARKSRLRLVSIRYLETPFVLPQFLHGVERIFRKFLPDPLKSSMLIQMIRAS